MNIVVVEPIVDIDVNKWMFVDIYNLFLDFFFL